MVTSFSIKPVVESNSTEQWLQVQIRDIQKLLAAEK